MNIRAIGKLIRERRRAKRMTLTELAEKAAVGRSTLAALEAGKLRELGVSRIQRLCAAVDLILEVRPAQLDAPITSHRHLTELAGRELTKAAIDDIITRGNIDAWRALVRAMRADESGRIARRVRDLTKALERRDERARAFSALLPKLLEQ